MSIFYTKYLNVISKKRKIPIKISMDAFFKLIFVFMYANYILLNFYRKKYLKVYIYFESIYINFYIQLFSYNLYKYCITL